MHEITFAETGGGVGEIVLNRPEKRNAINTRMRAELVRLLRAEEVRACKVVILRAEGPVFSAGKDLREVSTVDPAEDVAEAVELLTEFRRTPPVILACVAGPALGLGSGLVLACDLAVAAADADLGYPEIAHGLVAALTLVGVQQAVGFKQGLEILLTGRRIPAAEALAMGMVNEVTPPGGALDRARKLAATLAKFDLEALRATKDFYYRAAELGYHQGLAAAGPVIQAARASRAARSGIAAFAAAHHGSDHDSKGDGQ